MNCPTRRIISFMLCILIPSVVVGQEDSLQVAGLTKTVDTLVKRYAAYGFSGVVLVSKKGETILNKGYGFSNQAIGEQNTSATYFDLASITKQFTSAAILLLFEQGKMSLDDTISKHLPEVPSDKTGITIQQLLDHTSGITKTPRDLYYETARHDLARAIFETPLRAPPGTSFDYENENYNLLALLIEQIINQPFESFIKSQLLEPQDLFEVYFEREDVPGLLAQQYVGRTNSIKTVPIQEGAYRLGAGGAKATANGLHQWIRALIEGSVLQKTTLDKLMLQQSHEQPYQNAWSHRTTDVGQQVIEIAGDLEGFQHQLQYYPAEDIVVIVLSNTRVNGFQWRQRVAEDVARIVLQIPGIMPVPRDSITQEMSIFAGTYVSDKGDQLIIEPAGATTFKLSGSGQNVIDLLNFTAAANHPIVNQLNNRLVDASTRLKQGETAVIEAFMEEETILRFQRDWQELQNTSGNLLSFKLLGSIPNGPVRFTTLIEYEFDQGSTLTVRFYWDRNHEKLVGWWAKPREPAVSTWFYSVGNGSWASFNPLLREQATLKFNNDQQLTTTLTLSSALLSITAILHGK